MTYFEILVRFTSQNPDNTALTQIMTGVSQICQNPPLTYKNYIFELFLNRAFYIGQRGSLSYFTLFPYLKLN